MRGGIIHNEVMAARLVERARALGALVQRERVIRSAERTGYADLVIERDGIRLLVEVERSPRRLGRDVDKAIALGATSLWVVVPNRAMARRVAPPLRVETAKGQLPGEACVLTLPQALHRLERCFPLNSRCECPLENKSGGER